MVACVYNPSAGVWRQVDLEDHLVVNITEMLSYRCNERLCLKKIMWGVRKDNTQCLLLAIIYGQVQLRTHMCAL